MDAISVTNQDAHLTLSAAMSFDCLPTISTPAAAAMAS